MSTKKKDKPTTILMPEVKDIPGQEHIKPPRMEGLIDSTPSSAGDEGEGLLDDLNKEDSALIDDETDVTPEEEILLTQASNPVDKEISDLQQSALDSTDEDDELINESANPLDMGKDLDIPGSEEDDENEEIGEEDEENNSYSQRD